MKHDVFISYSSFDEAIARDVCRVLEENGICCWIALRDAKPGNPYACEIMSGIEESKMLLLIFSSNSNVSEHVASEIEEAFNKKKPIIVFLIENKPMTQELKYFLKRKHWLVAYPDYKQKLGNLVHATNNILGASKVVNKEDVVTEESRAKEYKIIQVNGIEYKFIKIEGGTFDMGAENSRYDESPVHQVTLSDYYIAETPVTQELWNAVMGNNPSCFKGEELPVEQVSWMNCVEFIKKISSITDMELRLPTEAEWEYAARGGKYSKGYMYSGGNDIDQVAWWAGNSADTTHAVKTKKPNELGIYDMSGNVWEWCNDNYASYSNESVLNPQGPTKETSKIQRGGCWDGQLFANKDSCEVTYRSSDLKTYFSKRIGLRLAMGVSNSPISKKTKILPSTFKLSIAGKDIHMLLSANKKYYIGNVLDNKSQFKWLSANSGINSKDIIITGAAITAIVVSPVLSLLYWLFASGNDKKNDEVIIDENFCNAISGEYKFSIPNTDELKDVVESEKSHCFVLRLSENPNLKESLTKLQ